MKVGQFTKGHVPANKGLRRPGWAPGRMAATQFKKGQRPRNAVPVGTVLPNSDGYLRRKVAEPNRWVFIHREVWEAAHGPIPRGMRIWWKDGNHANCALDNLELLTGAEHIARTSMHTNYPPEVVQLIQLRGRLTRKINRQSESFQGATP